MLEIKVTCDKCGKSYTRGVMEWSINHNEMSIRTDVSIRTYDRLMDDGYQTYNMSSPFMPYYRILCAECAGGLRDKLSDARRRKLDAEHEMDHIRHEYLFGEQQ